MFWNILMFIYIIYNNKLSRVILISHSKNVHTRGTIFYILCTKTYERHLFSLHHMGECIVCFSFVFKKKKKKNSLMNSLNTSLEPSRGEGGGDKKPAWHCGTFQKGGTYLNAKKLWGLKSRDQEVTRSFDLRRATIPTQKRPS